MGSCNEMVITVRWGLTVVYQPIQCLQKDEIIKTIKVCHYSNFLCCQVHSEYQFRRSVSNRSIEEEMQALNQDDQLPEFELGFLRLAKDKPFFTEKCVVWLGAGNSGFTLICHKEENRVLAENVLKLLIRYLQEYLRVLNQPAEAALKADRVCLVTQKFLPDGSLTFMNHRVIRSLERELEILIKT